MIHSVWHIVSKLNIVVYEDEMPQADSSPFQRSVLFGLFVGRLCIYIMLPPVSKERIVDLLYITLRVLSKIDSPSHQYDNTVCSSLISRRLIEHYLNKSHSQIDQHCTDDTAASRSKRQE